MEKNRFSETLFDLKNDDEGEKIKLTGYSIYKKDQEKRIKKNNLPEIFPDLPRKKYSIIYADPPWDYNGKMQFDRSSKSVDKIIITKNIFISAADFKYPTLKIEVLRQIPIVDIEEDNCLLFLWVTNPHLEQGLSLGKAWGFEYRTVAFVWDKLVHNPGQYNLSYCELCLLFKRGKIPTPRGTRNEKQLVRVKRGNHSEKPSEVRESIERMFPTQNKIELFARSKKSGWDSWGLDIRDSN